MSSALPATPNFNLNPNLAGVGEGGVNGKEKNLSEESLQITRVRFSFLRKILFGNACGDMVEKYFMKPNQTRSIYLLLHPFQIVGRFEKS